jgi:hypothetical protein
MGTIRRGVAGLTAVIIAGLLLGCGDGAGGPTGPDRFASPLLGLSANSASTITTNDQVPFSFTVFVPCANGGAGEDVFVSGTLHVLTHQTISSSGNVQVKVHFQPQGATGVGQTTGDTYHATGVTQEEFNQNGTYPFTDTFVNNFRLIGPGPNNNLLIHENLHITINANGVVTAFVDNFSIECR